MHRRNWIAWIAISSIAVPPVLAASSVEKLRNPKVLVTEDTLAAGETESLAGNRPSIIVYLAGNAAEVASAGGKARNEPVWRGETVFEPARAASIKNAGSVALRFARVEFLTAGLQLTWGRTGLAPNYKVLLENQYARVYDIRIPAHSFEPRHTHHDRVVVCLSGATLEHILPNGQRQPSTLNTGEIVWRPGATHVGHNMGATDLWAIAIEPK